MWPAASPSRISVQEALFPRQSWERNSCSRLLGYNAEGALDGDHGNVVELGLIEASYANVLSIMDWRKIVGKVTPTTYSSPPRQREQMTGRQPWEHNDQSKCQHIDYRCSVHGARDVTPTVYDF